MAILDMWGVSHKCFNGYDYPFAIFSLTCRNSIMVHTIQKFYTCVHRYTRNLVDEGNGKYNLIVLCWGEGHGSCIHSHADSHCFMKVLSGTLKETLFEWPDESVGEMQPMQQTGSELYCTDEVTYINGEHGWDEDIHEQIVSFIGLWLCNDIHEQIVSYVQHFDPRDLPQACIRCWTLQ